MADLDFHTKQLEYSRTQGEQISNNSQSYFKVLKYGLLSEPH